MDLTYFSKHGDEQIYVVAELWN